MRRAFTLLELIFVIVISSILAIGSFKALGALYLRSAKAKAITNLSLESQIVLDQLSALIYNRIPNSLIGYSPTSGSPGTCESITELSVSRKILEWIAIDEANLTSRHYDGFVDLNASVKYILSALDINKSAMGDVTNLNLVFAGTFDEGSDELSACNGAFGWHGNDSNLSFNFSIPENNKIEITDSVKPEFIYEKYYLATTAYAVARGENISDISNCNLSKSDFSDFNNTLFLFYNYRPYKDETFCADGGTGDVSVLAKHVSSFRVTLENETIRLAIDMNKTINDRKDVHISKQKAVF